MKKNRKNKTFQSALFRPFGRWTGNTFLFEGGLIDSLGSTLMYHLNIIPLSLADPVCDHPEPLYYYALHLVCLPPLG